jgi:hypothetical protein
MLLNEFSNEHHKVEEEHACKLSQQENRIAEQPKQIEALTAGCRM